jgi:hypothetical protein
LVDDSKEWMHNGEKRQIVWRAKYPFFGVRNFWYVNEVELTWFTFYCDYLGRMPTIIVQVFFFFFFAMYWSP